MWPKHGATLKPRIWRWAWIRYIHRQEHYANEWILRRFPIVNLHVKILGCGMEIDVEDDICAMSDIKVLIQTWLSCNWHFSAIPCDILKEPLSPQQKYPRWEALKARWSPKITKIQWKDVLYAGWCVHTLCFRFTRPSNDISEHSPNFQLPVPKKHPKHPQANLSKEIEFKPAEIKLNFDKLGIKTTVHSLVVSFPTLPLLFCKPVAKGDFCKRPRTKFTWQGPINFHESMASHVQRWECMSQDWHQASRISKSLADNFKMDSWQVSMLAEWHLAFCSVSFKVSQSSLPMA